jgi:hypothetical protein
MILVTKRSAYRMCIHPNCGSASVSADNPFCPDHQLSRRVGFLKRIKDRLKNKPS